MVYSNYVTGEGLEIFKIYLQSFGFIHLDDDKDFDKNNLNISKSFENDNFRYCEFHGGINKELRTFNKNIFNLKDNKYGKYCKIILLSPAGAEGINLSNVRQVHILEPYWNETKIEQIIGRAVRFCQHKDLPFEERKVDIFRYKATRENGKLTSDEIIENLAKQKHNLLTSFIESVKEVAIDCNLFKSHNMMTSQYNCFQFNQESLFETAIGPAYVLKLEQDMSYNNGLNSVNSISKKIKVRKISAIKELSYNKYSESMKYWLDDETSIIYDLNLKFPIGKLLKDESNDYVLHDNNYIINSLINIPSI